MKIVYAGAAVALAVVAGYAGMFSTAPGVDPMVVSSVHAASAAGERFSLRASGEDAGCFVSAVGEGDRRSLRLNAACKTLVPGLAGAAWWLERDDGSVAFAGADGRVVAEFAIADGAAFESYAPQQPVMTLLAQ